jgi:hypothetical protein
VTATPVPINGAAATWCVGESPQALLSVAGGVADFVFDNGTVNLAAGLIETLDFDVTAQGPGPGAAVSLADCPDPLFVISFDLDGVDLDVDIVDFAQFGSDLGSVNVRSDFNFSGGVTDIIDFAMFGAHLNKLCP